MSATLPSSLIDAVSEYLPDRFKCTPLHGGRTNRVWQIDGGSSKLVLKLYARAGDTPLFRNDARAEWSCLTHLSGTGLAPEPVAAGKFDLGDWLLYQHVQGSEWQIGVAAVARRLCDLHQHSAPDGISEAPGGSAELSVQTHDILATCKGPRAVELAAMRPEGAVPPGSDLTLIHGDPVPGNIVQADSTLTFIDWQCPALGDACEDIALFLSPAMQQVYRGDPLSQAERQVFLDAYPDQEVTDRYLRLAPWFHWRMSAYCLWRTQRGDADYAPGLALELSAVLGLRSVQKSRSQNPA